MVTIEIKGAGGEHATEGEAFARMVAQAFAHQIGYSVDDDGRLTEKIERAVTKLIGERIESKLEEILAKRVGALVEEVFAEGWQPTDEWGNAEGPRQTLVQRVKGALGYKSPPKNRFTARSGERTPLETAVDEVLSREIPAMVAEEKKRVRVILKKAIDAKLAGSVVEAMREALGLRG